MQLSGHELTCVRGERVIFDALNFEVGGGEALVVTGRNGVGKSSLLRILAGLIAPASGTIALEGAGEPEDNVRPAERAHYLGHRDALKASLTVRENLSFWQDFLGAERDEGMAALALVGLDDIAELPAGFLSAGQRRRLSVARLIAVKRPVWLLDEPSSTLDDAGQAMLATVMNAHLASGGLIVAATHSPLDLAPMRELKLGAAEIRGAA